MLHAGRVKAGQRLAALLAGHSSMLQGRQTSLEVSYFGQFRNTRVIKQVQKQEVMVLK